MQLTNRLENAAVSVTPACIDPDLILVFHARHWVRLVARSRLMIHDLEYHDPAMLSQHLFRIRTIADEACMGDMREASGQLLAQLPDLGQVDIYRRVMQLHDDIMMAYIDSRCRTHVKRRH